MTGGRFGRRTVCAVLAAGAWLAATPGTAAQAPDAAAQAPRAARVVLSVNAGLQTTVNTRADRIVFGRSMEVGHFEATQRLGRTVLWDVGVSRRVWKGLGLGAHVTRTRITSSARIEASVPHPYFFSFPRTANRVADGLAHQEWALHVQFRHPVPSGWLPGWLPLGDDFRLTVFAGPSLYEASQDLVAEIRPAEVGFPFEIVEIRSHAIHRTGITAVGFNAGFDLSWFGLGRFERLGLGTSLRFNRAAPGIAVAHQTQPALELGGTQVVGGVRYAF